MTGIKPSDRTFVWGSDRKTCKTSPRLDHLGWILGGNHTYVEVDYLKFEDSEHVGVCASEDGTVTALAGDLVVNGVTKPQPPTQPLSIDSVKEATEGRRGMCVVCLEYIATRLPLPCACLCFCETCFVKFGSEKEHKRCPIVVNTSKESSKSILCNPYEYLSNIYQNYALINIYLCINSLKR